MRATTIIIGFVLFGMCMAGFGMFITDLNANYDTSLSTESLVLLNQINETYDYTVGVGTEMQRESSSIGAEGVSSLSTAEKIINSLKILYESVVLIPTSITYVASTIGLPDWLVYGFLSIVLLVLLIGIVRLIVGAIRGSGE